MALTVKDLIDLLLSCPASTPVRIESGEQAWAVTQVYRQSSDGESSVVVS